MPKYVVVNYTANTLYKRRTIWAGAIVFVLALTAGIGDAFGQEETRLEKYDRFDRDYNVIRRKRTEGKEAASTLTEEQKAPKELAYFKVSATNSFVQLLTSSSITKAELDSLVHTGADGKQFVVLPILKSETNLYRLLRVAFGKPIAISEARKLIGHTTHTVFSNDLVSEDFFIKWISPMPGENTHARRALMTNDYVETGDTLLPQDLRSHLINDVAILEINLGGFKAAIGFRSTRKIKKPVNGGTVYPGHGLLGCDSCIEDFAAKMGISARKWKQTEFIPMLARLTAYSHFVLGAYYATHTQNLLIEVDEKTGRILKLYIRDLGDVVIDPLVRLAWREIALGGRIRVHTLPLSAHHLFADRQRQEAREAGPNTATYTIQSIGAHLKGFQARGRDSILFLEHYTNGFREIFGRAPELSERARGLVRQIESLIEESKTAKFEIEAETSSNAEIDEAETSRGKLRKEMISQVVQEIFDQGKTELVARVSRKIEASGDQNALRLRFKSALRQQKIAFASAEAREKLMPGLYKNWIGSHVAYGAGLPYPVNSLLENLDFGELSGGQVVAMDRNNGAILGATFLEGPSAMRLGCEMLLVN